MSKVLSKDNLKKWRVIFVNKPKQKPTMWQKYKLMYCFKYVIVAFMEITSRHVLRKKSFGKLFLKFMKKRRRNSLLWRR